MLIMHLTQREEKNVMSDHRDGAVDVRLEADKKASAIFAIVPLFD